VVDWADRLVAVASRAAIRATGLGRMCLLFHSFYLWNILLLMHD
jgi:hypothetical protein